MCGIWVGIGQASDAGDAERALEALKGRGPEGSRMQEIRAQPHGSVIFGFTRLAINGLSDAGMQPFRTDTHSWICNGELYNWRELQQRHGLSLTSGSDCEVLGHLLERLEEQELGVGELFAAIDGVFAAAIVNVKTGVLTLARDPYGVRPLYVAESMGRLVAAASEIKALPNRVAEGGEISIHAFPPGHVARYSVWSGMRLSLKPYHTIPVAKIPMPNGGSWAALRQALETAVRKRLMTERPVAALLSGGVDSSLIAALVARELKRCGAAAPLKTFSIGMEGSTDLHYARLVAEHIGSEHHEIVMTEDEFFAAVPAVIRDIESFDTTTVRASVGNWLVAREIARRTDCKVVFNGDGSDEVFGSYMYFKKAPSDEAFEAEVTRLLKDIHMFDVLRSDRSISSHGLEPRTPFLDKTFVATARAVVTELRRPRGERMEKHVLRAAFDGTGLLPDAVLWRRKEAFSDGVSGQEKSWYQIAQEKAEALVPADWRERITREFPMPRPTTAEQYYYRSIYQKEYGWVNTHVSPNVPYFWMPRWCEGATDPSARTLGADVYGSGSGAAAAAPSSAHH